MHFTSDDSKVPKNKPCKRNNHQNLANIKTAAKESNAEERLHADCKIYGEEQRYSFAAFLFTGIFQADKPQEFEGRALNNRQAANLSSK